MENDEDKLNERQLEIVVGGSKNSMQMVYQNWREYLQEDEQKEFGPKFDAAIKDCDKLQNGMIGADKDGASTGCLEEKGFELLGEGGFRNVYALPGSAGKHYVLKVGTNDPQSSKMNEAEADVRMQRNYSDMIPKTYKYADDYKWIVMERVFPWGGENDTNWIKKFFPAFGDEEYIKKQLVEVGAVVVWFVRSCCCVFAFMFVLLSVYVHAICWYAVFSVFVDCL